MIPEPHLSDSRRRREEFAARNKRDNNDYGATLRGWNGSQSTMPNKNGYRDDEVW